MKAATVGLSVLLAFATLVPLARDASAEGATPQTAEINVRIGRAVVVNSDQPFHEIVVDKPAFAEVTGINDRSVFVLGKSQGVTKLLLLDQSGAAVAEVIVSVGDPPQQGPKTVTVRRGANVSRETVD